MTLLSRLLGRAGLSGIVLGVCLVPAAVRAAEPGPSPQAKLKAPERRLDAITLEEFRAVSWRPRDNSFKTNDPVRILLEDTRTHERVVLEADDAEGTPEGDIVVRGHLRLSREEGAIEGRALHYKAADQTGSVSDARAQMGSARVEGKQIELLPNERLKATDSRFTLCACKRPDFHLTAHEIVISASGRVSAKRIGFFVGGTRLFSLPTFTRTFRQQSQSPLPMMPAYTKNGGIEGRIRDDIINTPDTFLDYSIRLATKDSPDGAIDFERDLTRQGTDAAPPRLRVLTAKQPLRAALEAAPALIEGEPQATEFGSRRASLYTLLHVDQYVYNRKHTNLQLSRLPEVGFAVRNLLNRTLPEDDPTSKRPPSQTAFGKGVFSPAEWLINAEVGVGWLREMPTRVERGRLGLRADASSPLFRFLDPIYFRYGGFASAAAYDDGNAYTILSPEVEADVFLNRNTLIGVGFRYAQEFGQTPFLFDRLDVRNEMRLRYSVVRSTWGYDVSVNYDMDRVRAYDTIFSVRRRFDCMEVGLSYQTRAQNLGLIFNLLPVTRAKAAGAR